MVSCPDEGEESDRRAVWREMVLTGSSSLVNTAA